MSNWYLPLYDALSWFACFHKYNISPPKGKVHGSLARAGKVRGQTPKVSLHVFASLLKLFPIRMYSTSV